MASLLAALTAGIGFSVEGCDRQCVATETGIVCDGGVVEEPAE